MGAYHCRCLITGISLRFADCVCVFVQRVGDAWRPASLPMRGQFNSFGTISDGERGYDYYAREIVKSFEEAVKDKRIVLDGDARWRWKNSRETGLDRILETVERTAPGHGAVTFRDAPISHTLFQAPVWDAICAQVEPTKADLDLLSPFGRWWYEDLARFPSAEVRTKVQGGLAQIAAVDAWMTAHEIPWSTPRVFSAPGEVHDARDILGSVREARKNFAGTPLAGAVDAAAATIEGFAWDPPSGWITGVDVSWYAIAIGDERYACTHADQILSRIETALIDPSTLLSKPAELLAVDRGDIVARFDLRQFLRLRAGTRSATLEDVAACEDLLTDPDAECRVELAPIDLPQLHSPLATSDQALLIVPTPAPAWITVNERYDVVIPFAF